MKGYSIEYKLVTSIYGIEYKVVTSVILHLEYLMEYNYSFTV